MTMADIETASSLEELSAAVKGSKAALEIFGKTIEEAVTGLRAREAREEAEARDVRRGFGVMMDAPI
jgi:hypothetical protein